MDYRPDEDSRGLFPGPWHWLAEILCTNFEGVQTKTNKQTKNNRHVMSLIHCKDSNTPTSTLLWHRYYFGRLCTGRRLSGVVSTALTLISRNSVLSSITTSRDYSHVAFFVLSFMAGSTLQLSYTVLCDWRLLSLAVPSYQQRLHTCELWIKKWDVMSRVRSFKTVSRLASNWILFTAGKHVSGKKQTHRDERLVI